jgi:hypothetical protein
MSETMWAVVNEDHEWECSTEGDKGDGDTLVVVILNATTFPVGTRLSIDEPAEDDVAFAATGEEAGLPTFATSSPTGEIDPRAWAEAVKHDHNGKPLWLHYADDEHALITARALLASYLRAVETLKGAA